MSKPSVLGDVVNKHTVDVHLRAFLHKFVTVEGAHGGKVLVVVDTAAWLFWSTGVAAARILRAMKANMNEITYAWLEGQVFDCKKLQDDLQVLRRGVEMVREAFERKGASVTVRFVSELREPDQIKTPKIPRDLTPLDEARFARLNAALNKKRLNSESITERWRECTRGPEGHEWATLGAALLFAAVKSVFAGMEFEFGTTPDGDGCFSSYDADVVIAITRDRDQSNIFPTIKRKGQVLVQFRSLWLFGRDVMVGYCDSSATYHALVEELLPLSWAVLGGACNYLVDAMCLLSDVQQVAVFAVWALLCSRTEFTDILFWGRNLQGEERNVAYRKWLAIADVVLAELLRELFTLQPNDHGSAPRLLEGFYARVLEQAAMQRGVFRSLSANEENVRLSIAQSLRVALPISGRVDGLEGVWFRRIAAVTGIPVDHDRVCNRVDPHVGKIMFWTVAEARQRVLQVQRAFESLPPPFVAPVSQAPRQGQEAAQPKHNVLSGNSFAELVKSTAQGKAKAKEDKKAWEAKVRPAASPPPAAPPPLPAAPPPAAAATAEPPLVPLPPPPPRVAAPVAFAFGAAAVKPPPLVERVESEEKRPRGLEPRPGPLRAALPPRLINSDVKKSELMQRITNAVVRGAVVEAHLEAKSEDAWRRVVGQRVSLYKVKMEENVPPVRLLEVQQKAAGAEAGWKRVNAEHTQARQRVDQLRRIKDEALLQQQRGSDAGIAVLEKLAVEAESVADVLSKLLKAVRVWWSRGVRQREKRREKAAAKAAPQPMVQPVAERVREVEKVTVPPLPQAEEDDEEAAAKKRAVKVVPPTAPTAKEATKEQQREARKAQVNSKDQLYPNQAVEAIKKKQKTAETAEAANVGTRKRITHVLDLRSLKAEPIVQLLDVTTSRVQLMESMLVTVHRAAQGWHRGLPLTHPAFFEVLCQAEVQPDGSVVLPKVFDYVRNDGREVVAGFECVRLSGTTFRDAFVLGCSKAQLEEFVSCCWSAFSLDAKESVLTCGRVKGLMSAASHVRKKVCGRVARTGYMVLRLLLGKFLRLILTRDVAGKNSHLLKKEDEVLEWAGLKEIKEMLEEVDVDDDDDGGGGSGPRDEKKVEDALEVDETDEVAAARERMQKEAAVIGAKIARLFVHTKLVLGDVGVVSLEQVEGTVLRDELERYTLPKWKEYWKETGHLKSSVFPNEGGDRFFSMDLAATIARLDREYHQRPLLGMLKHMTVPRYATARAVFIDNKAMLDVMMAKTLSWFRSGRTGDNVGGKLGLGFEFVKAADALERPVLKQSLERHFDAFQEAQGVVCNGAGYRSYGFAAHKDARRRPEWLTEKQLRAVNNPKMADLISPAWMEYEWRWHCLTEFGRTRPFHTRPNKDSATGLPGRGLVKSSVMCQVFKKDDKAGAVLYLAANVVGGDFGQHHVVHFAPRAGERVDSLWDTGRQYAHYTKRSLHGKLGKMAAAMRMPEDVKRQVDNERLTERLRCGGGTGAGGVAPDEAFFAAATPSDFSFTIELEKATEAEVVKYALAWVWRLRKHYDALGRFENIVIVMGKEFGSVGRGQAVANRKRILDILSDHFLVVLYDENNSSQVHYKCGSLMEQYRKHEVRTKICYCCSLERKDGLPELVNRDFNASVNMVDWFCYELQYHQRPRVACGLKRVIAPIQGDENASV